MWTFGFLQWLFIQKFSGRKEIVRKIINDNILTNKEPHHTYLKFVLLLRLIISSIVIYSFEKDLKLTIGINKFFSFKF